MIKIILCFFIICLCGLIGYGMSNYYLQRKKFFQSLNNFFSSLKTDIGFSSKNLQDIIIFNKNNSNYSVVLRKLLSNFNEIIKNENTTQEHLFKDINILTIDEKEFLFYFFSKLGKSDIFSQLEEIDKSYIINEKTLKECTEDYKKYSGLYIKLGIIIGVFITILII